MPSIRHVDNTRPGAFVGEAHTASYRSRRGRERFSLRGTHSDPPLDTHNDVSSPAHDAAIGRCYNHARERSAVGRAPSFGRRPGADRPDYGATADSAVQSLKNVSSVFVFLSQHGVAPRSPLRIRCAPPRNHAAGTCERTRPPMSLCGAGLSGSGGARGEPVSVTHPSVMSRTADPACGDHLSPSSSRIRVNFASSPPLRATRAPLTHPAVLGAGDLIPCSACRPG